ncbi:unnamed protein product [Candidula unifasciata]|uniref:Sushi domain-containing protein n=1 Tax=Candidula unifasciata TaxID=100452 RepID=A0A8S3ZFL5_9EUPU|nr:unnamed protein product [Candidula unifasciata]
MCTCAHQPDTYLWNCETYSTSCRNESAYAEVPRERTQWLGSVQLTMECDPGYDMPLNSPVNSTLTCLPDGSTWKPDYLPDCNEKIVATAAEMTMTGQLPSATCDGLGQFTTSRTTLTFASSRRLVITEMCRQHLLSCAVVRASIDCQDKSANGGSPPHIFLSLAIVLAPSTHWSMYTKKSVPLALTILRSLEERAVSSHVNTTITPVCRIGTVGVLRAGSEVVCRGCSLGHYLDSVNKICVPCSPGYYGDRVLSTSCKLCPGMSSYYGTLQWERILKVIPNRAHSISSCPILYKHTNGTLEVRVPSKIHAQLSQLGPEEGRTKPRDANDGKQPSLDSGSKLVIATFVLSALSVA